MPSSAALAEVPSPFRSRGYQPSPANPLVYHLHGHVDLPESIVLSEDDYLDFIVRISREPNRLPHQIRRALSNTSLMFIGDRLADWDFRVIHRGLMASVTAGLQRLNVTVQLPDPEAARDYLSAYYQRLPATVYWGTAAEFARELHTRLDGHADL